MIKSSNNQPTNNHQPHVTVRHALQHCSCHSGIITAIPDVVKPAHQSKNVMGQVVKYV
jgi:hypothetical protein